MNEGIMEVFVYECQNCVISWGQLPSLCFGNLLNHTHAPHIGEEPKNKRPPVREAVPFLFLLFAEFKGGDELEISLAVVLR